MDEIEHYQIGLKIRIGNSLTLEPFVRQQVRSISGYNYKYVIAQSDGVSISQDEFLTDLAGVNFRIAIGEKYARVFKSALPQPSKYPVLQGRILNNGLITPGNYSFTSVALQFDHHFLIKLFGELNYRISAGYVDRVAPYPFLFNGRSNFGKNGSINSFGSFETMRLNEFLSDRYVSANVYYDLKSLLFKSRKITPGIILVGSAMVGDLRKTSNHQNLDFKVPIKGYYETGLMVTKLFTYNYNALGLGLFYRLGDYKLPQVKNNLAFKLNFTINID